jgi:uncharacterized protein YehS (DUF1456 family)
VINNDILRRFRYALNISDVTMLEIFALSGHAIEPSMLADLLKKEDEKGFVECSSEVMTFFLDGLIVQKRGKTEAKPGQAIRADSPLTNNAILKKLRIALEFKEEDMLETLKLGGMEISKSELSALFRKKGHKHYKECGDQFLRTFLKGLAVHQRG